MINVKKRLPVLSSFPELEETFNVHIGSLRTRSSSTRNISNLEKNKRKQNLSLVRVLSSNIAKNSKKTKITDNKNFRLKSVCSRLSSKIRSVSRENQPEYFSTCKSALQDLINLKQPISYLLSNIQYAFEQELKTKNKEKPNNIDTTEIFKDTLNTEAVPKQSSIFERFKKRKLSRKKMNFPIKNKDHQDLNQSLFYVPKLNIKKIIISKQDSSEKITNTHDDTFKQHYIQDYQDEFMSKFNEFSQSWRLQILEKSKTGY
jgi:hypothetical protein